MDLKKNFTYHESKEGDVIKYQNIRNLAHELAKYIDTECPDSREKSLAITKIEEAVMWANASVARY